MAFSILTPAMNSLPHLKSCIAAVRSQATHGEGIELVHRIHDAASSDGTRAYLDSLDRVAPGYRLETCIEPDDGMYDALNRAFAATTGEIVGHLNTDEQYLQGTLEFVSGFFQSHPGVDVLIGAVVVVEPGGGYICSRIPVAPRTLHTRISHLDTLTAGIFYRHRAIESLGVYFDTSFNIAGDADLVLRMLQAGLRMETTSRYLATFMDSGANLALSPRRAEEQQRLAAGAPAWARAAKPLLVAHHRLRKLLRGAYQLDPFQYPFVSPDGHTETHQVDNPRGRWIDRHWSGAP